MKETNKKQQAISLRKKGFSYNLITDKIGTLKSALSAWLKDVPFLPNKEVKKTYQSWPTKIRHVAKQTKVGGHDQDKRKCNQGNRCHYNKRSLDVGFGIIFGRRPKNLLN
ncbi:MAG: hypothetical protein WCF93_03175 [Candidatus Moraniibacteriota bacterium]